MNYNDINSIYKRINNIIYPNVKVVWNTLPEKYIALKYLSYLGDERKYSALTVPYLFNPVSFFSKFKDNCVYFSHSVDPNDGQMMFLHQLNPELHLYSTYFCWLENDVIFDHVKSSLLYKNYSDAIKFITEHHEFANTGDTSKIGKPLGFGQH